MNSLDASSFDSLPPAKLALLLDVEGGEGAGWPGDGGWTPADAAAALRQQLGTPLLPDLLVVPGAEKKRLEHLVETCAQTHSFGAQLTGPDPTPELLEMLKRWARFMRDQRSSPLHGGPATVLYYAAIAAALAGAGQRMTRLPDSQLRAGFEWAMIQEGAEGLRELFGAALGRLG